MTNPPKHLEVIRRSFSAQAAQFESPSMNFTKQSFLDYTVEAMALQPHQRVLECAAGTCACGRSLAPFVRSVTCLDTTPAMLAIGKKEAAQAGLTNMTFVEGLVEALPFEDDSFDVVVCRLAFHHFTEVEQAFSEMARVLAPNGTLCIIDMEAAEQSLREREDHLETLRDPSHVKNLSREEFLALFEAHGLTVTRCETTPISVSLSAWLALTQTSKVAAQTIQVQLVRELAGGDKTGFEPFLDREEIHFWQRWMLLLGQKS